MAAQWKSEYRPNSEYSTPQRVRDDAEFHLNRTSPVTGWADGALQAAFEYVTPTSSPTHSVTPTSVPAPGGLTPRVRNALISVFVVVPVVVIVGVTTWWWWRRRPTERVVD
jgi:hypothetical protein